MVLLDQTQRELAAAPRGLRDRPPLRGNIMPQALAVIDSGVVVTLSLACGLIVDFMHSGGAGPLDRHLGFGVAAAILFTALAYGRGLYLPSRLRHVKWQLTQAALLWTVVFICLLVGAFALGADRAVGREPVLPFFVTGLAGIAALRCGGERALRRFAPTRALARRQVMVVAQSGQSISPAVARLAEAYGGNLCKTVVLPPIADERAFSECMAGVVEYVRRRSVEEILLAVSWADADALGKIAAHLGIVPLPVRLMPDPVIGALLERPLVDLGPTRAIELQRAPITGAQLVAKRLVDLIVTIPVLLLLLPVWAAIAALILVDSRGPVLFRQRRAGFNGRTFHIYKFRTMTSLDDGAVVEQARRGDPRVTRVGQVLRRFSIDELPQLLNVLKGEMSLVGPRPHALAHDDEYGRLIALYAARHKVKPGITGWAQVNGWRGATPQIQLMIRRVEHDLWYVDHWSLWLDIKILLLTPFSVYSTRNAY